MGIKIICDCCGTDLQDELYDTTLDELSCPYLNNNDTCCVKYRKALHIRYSALADKYRKRKLNALHGWYKHYKKVNHETF